MPKQTVQECVTFGDNRLVPVLYGRQNAHLKKIENALNVQIGNRGNEITISGTPENTERAKKILEALWSKLEQGQDIDKHTVESALRFLEEHTNGDGLKHFTEAETFIKTRKKEIRPRSPLQTAYIQAMNNSRLVFSLGPAGTGKTYLTVAMAVAMLESGKVERIILSRPAVEAGERLGFLPGEMKEKMDPYMRPLYDSLYDTMAGDTVQKKIAAEEIEIAPLAFMRGRTLNNAFIILDEAQNTTDMQMLMFLTRIGENSRMVVTGDPSQTDLPENQKSGLLEARDILKGDSDISFIEFSSEDIVRSKMVTRIIRAYEKRTH